MLPVVAELQFSILLQNHEPFQFRVSSNNIDGKFHPRRRFITEKICREICP